MRNLLVMAVVLVVLVTVPTACGKRSSSKDAKANEKPAQPLFVSVEGVSPHHLPMKEDVPGDQPTIALPEATAAEPAKSSGMFYVNSPDDVGPANQGYAEGALPEGSLAQRLGVRQPGVLRWRPRWHYQGAGGVSLTAAALSDDGSVLGLIEVAAASGEAAASMLVLFDTHRWTFLRLHEFSGKRLVRLAFVPGRMQAVAVAERQPEFGQPQEIMLLDLGQGKVTASSRQVRSPVVEIISHAGNHLLILADHASGHPGGLWRLDCRDLDAPPLARQPEIIGAAMAAAGNRIMVAGPQGVTFAGFSDLHQRQTLPTPGVASPEVVLFTDGPENLALLGAGQALLLIAGGAPRQLAERAGMAMVYNPDDQRLLAAMDKSHALNLYQLPGGELLGSAEPPRVKPRTNGVPWRMFWLKHLEKYLVIDTHGNICLYHQPSRKWRKEIILDAKR